MKNDLYISGFLYHPGSNQILLQRENSLDEKSLWSLLGGQENFQRLVDSLLNLNLPLKAIHPVYEYFDKGLHKNHQISYAVVKKLKDFPPKKKTVFAWFPMKKIIKQNLSDQTKQDLIVSQRVIDSAIRKKAGERTME